MVQWNRIKDAKTTHEHSATLSLTRWPNNFSGENGSGKTDHPYAAD